MWLQTAMLSSHEELGGTLTCQKTPKLGCSLSPEMWLEITCVETLGIKISCLVQSAESDSHSVDPKVAHDEVVADDQLRLIFLCADPEIPMESRLALTLKIAALAAEKLLGLCCCPKML
ncbi:MAG: hypothetical protein U0930_22910 [Pirellulales bacterium]